MNKKISTPVIRPDSIDKTAGYSKYLSDLSFHGLLHAGVLRSARSRARIISVRVPVLPGGYFFIGKNDIPPGGNNQVLMINRDWPVFADRETRFYGEIMGLVIGPDREKVGEIIKSIDVEYQDLEPALTIDEGLNLKGGPFHGDDNLFADLTSVKGDPDKAFSSAVKIIEDEITTGYQEQVYMEPQSVVGTWEDGKMTFYVSTQCPFYVRKAVSNALGVQPGEVRIKQTVTGGGFGGKEHYPDVLSSALAIALTKIKNPIRLVLDRTEDLSFTPKRHPSRIRFRTALDADGNILAMDIDTVLNAGAYESCSKVVLMRAMFHGHSVYNIPAIRIRGRAVATNNVPSDAFRGFGAPQGLTGMELHMTHIAGETGRDEVEFKRSLFMKKGDRTITNGMIHEEVKLPEMYQRVSEMADYDRKRELYIRGSGKGVGFSFFMHGSGFTGDGEQTIIKGVVRMRKLPGDQAALLVSSAEIGQGIQTAFRKIAAEVLDIPFENVLYDNPDTDNVPDSGPTCASRSIAIVGYLVQEAAKKLKARWNEGDSVEVVHEYRKPDFIEWDQENLQGDAYPSYGWGVNAVEVEVDPDTCEVTVKGVWTAFDVGVAIDERIIQGQIEGGMFQGLGWGSIEKLESRNGRFAQNTMADYVIPTSLDFPAIKSTIVDNPYEFGPFGAKGAGELTFDGAAAAYAAAVQHALNIPIDRVPVSPEYILEARAGRTVEAL